MDDISKDTKAPYQDTLRQLTRKRNEVITIDIERYKALVEENKKLKTKTESLSERCDRCEAENTYLKRKLKERSGQLKDAYSKGRRMVDQVKEYRHRLRALQTEREDILPLFESRVKQVEQYRQWIDELKEEMEGERKFYEHKLQEAWKEADRSWWRRLFRSK